MRGWRKDTGAAERWRRNLTLRLIPVFLDEFAETPPQSKYQFGNYFEAIKFYMEQKGYTMKELEKALGYKSRVSEILNRKRKLNLSMIRSLHAKWKIPLESLVSDY